MFSADHIIIRPPVEAYSVLIPVTGGCSWCRCRFCNTYRQFKNGNKIIIQEFEVRKLETVLQNIEFASKNYKKAMFVFLAGGNAFSAPTDYLISIIEHIKKHFPHVKRISIYAKILDILQKSDEELDKISEAGLIICYIGMETGSNKVLKYMNKGQTAKMEIRAVKKLLKSGIKASLYILLGLGGKKWSKIHARESAKVLNATNPTIFRFRTLNVMPGSPLEEDVENGSFKILTPLEIIKEQRLLISLLNEKLTSKFRNDHVSNYTNINSENIGKDKKKILADLDRMINDPEVAKWEHKNLKSM